VGKAITIGGEPHTVIGLMPPEYGFPFPGIDVWVTRLVSYTGLPAASVQNGGGFLLLVGRLGPGATVTTAAAGGYGAVQAVRQGTRGQSRCRSAGADECNAVSGELRGRHPARLVNPHRGGGAGAADCVGIRQAIGATRRDIVAMVLRQSIGISAAGIAAGAAAAVFATRV
jgi:hypothetical protein